MAMCSAFVGAMRNGYRDILAKGSNPDSVEETSNGDVRGVSGVAVLLYRYPSRGTSPYRSEIYAVCGLSQ